jgi:hypothetical protein
MVLNESAARFDRVAHQLGEGAAGVVDLRRSRPGFRQAFRSFPA